MPLYKVDIHYNRPMHTLVYLEVKQGEEVTYDTVQNFLSNYIESLSIEEDYHTGHEFHIKEIDKSEKNSISENLLWKIDAKTGE